MYDRVHSTLTDQAYKNLASAIINQAIDDVADYTVKTQSGKHLSRRQLQELKRDAESADRFLHDEKRLRVFTDLKPIDMDKAIQKKVAFELQKVAAS